MDKKSILLLVLGLGIGLFISSIFYNIYPKIEYKPITDQEIIERSKTLGMVSLKETISQDKAKEKVEEDREKIKESEGDIGKAKPEEIILNIEKGLNSEEIYDEIEKTKLIEDMEAFKKLVRDKDLEKSMKYGIYTLNEDITDEYLIDLITKINKK